MSKSTAGFTLIELLIAMALFVSLLGLTAVSFQRISAGSEKALQVLELHRKADALLRYMEFDVRNTQQVLALQLQTTKEPYTLTFMKPVNDNFDRYFHRGATLSSLNDFKPRAPRLTDTIWVRWSWENGSFSRGQSRNNNTTRGDSEQWGTATYLSNTKEYIKTVKVDQTIPFGVQNNGVTPTPQRHFDFFEGTGSTLYGVNADGSSTALPAQKIQVSETVNCSYDAKSNSDLFDLPSAPWRSGDLRHLHTTLDCGNQTVIPDAYAVRNPDGKTVNKDRLNILGADAVDADDNKIYPSQMQFLFDGVEFLSMELVKRDGKPLSASTESDRLGDGSASIDVSGIDPLTGDGHENRPSHLRISYLLHSIDLKEKDLEDYDRDGDIDEALSAAIRTVVENEGGTRLEKIRSYKKHAHYFGFAGMLISQSVRLGL